MKILFENTIIALPSDFMSVDDFMKWKGFNPLISKVYINGIKIPNKSWTSTNLQHLDRISVDTI
ncbi:hypothetical protein [Lepagella muris]|jgi:sulfur carrier protein ThiS|uniref:Uncharacterized protein n=1 Tax=Lepagella muris TaxID=3032870 RepID=A0AC61RIL3_9BACT|nr:hypothetical protein [Lepagella muris]TGY79808.1 hypothetical protein E5331_05380 [Lepagella muris]THG51788.1 hypothetical protein E5984_09770 [Bacteroidales bacterium]TKC54426.1 hypothetical protein E5359_018405 [Bacteroidales bacterium]